MSPRHQITGSLTLDQPIIAAAAWARRAQAQDNRQIAELSAAETRRQIALATADAYLSILARRAGPRGEQPRARHREGALRSRHRARAAGDRQPPERAAGAAAAVDVRAADRVRLAGGVSARRKRSACCSSRTVRSMRSTSRRSTLPPDAAALGEHDHGSRAGSAAVPARSEAVLRPAPGRASAC